VISASNAATLYFSIQRTIDLVAITSVQTVVYPGAVNTPTYVEYQGVFNSNTPTGEQVLDIVVGSSEAGRITLYSVFVQLCF
jgi:hypothetical protein